MNASARRPIAPIRHVITGLCFFVTACTSPGGSDAGVDAGRIDRLSDGGFATTWWKDVEPIVRSNCAGCHTPGGIAPFSLETYSDAKDRAESIRAAVENRSMPPWQPDPSCGGPFVDERRLSNTAIDVIGQWVAEGALEGDPLSKPIQMESPQISLPRVDARLAPTVAYTPMATGHDDYRCFVIDPALAAPTFITGYDVEPGVRSLVHHVVLTLADRSAAIAHDAQTADPGWPCFGNTALASAGAFGAWAPGTVATIFPNGTGAKISQNQVVIMQVHYNTKSAAPAPDRTHIKLMYDASNVTEAYLIELSDHDFSIPPNTSHYSVSKTFENPYAFPLKIWGMAPHMHLLGKQITFEATVGHCLIDIPAWDFHWQQHYFRSEPYLLGPGQSVKLTCTWNNNTNQLVMPGQNSTDEMCLVLVYATP